MTASVAASHARDRVIPVVLVDSIEVRAKNAQLFEIGDNAGYILFIDEASVFLRDSQNKWRKLVLQTKELTASERYYSFTDDTVVEICSDSTLSRCRVYEKSHTWHRIKLADALLKNSESRLSLGITIKEGTANER